MTANTDKLGVALDDGFQQFLLWSLKALRLRWERHGEQVFVLEVPEDQREALGSAEQLLFTFQPPAARLEEEVEYVTTRSRLYGWLMDRLAEPGRLLHAFPTNQPVSVHELSSTLFGAYTVEGGRVHLGGCTLDDRPILRLTFLGAGTSSSSPGELTHLFVNASGEPLADHARASLGLDSVSPLGEPPHRLGGEATSRWIAAGNHRHGRGANESQVSSTNDAPLVAATVVWCKFAEGKLRFLVENASAELAFSGWAQQLADGQLKPPPFECPYSGEKSYHLALTDDGQLSVVEAIGTCQETNRRVLMSELETCSTTGRMAIHERLVTCPVSDERVLRSALTTCGMCQQAVSSATIKDGRCAACRTVQSISKDDPRMARFLGEYPKLDRWRSWKISETAAVYVLVATGLSRRLLLVADKEGLEVSVVAKGTRFTRDWTAVSEADRDDLLQ